MAYRGMYGQAEGNEHRQDSAFLTERLIENDLVEGQHVTALHNMVKSHNWSAVNCKVKELLQAGFKQSRIDSMLTRAQHGVRL